MRAGDGEIQRGKHMTQRSGARTRRLADDGGAVMVEAALITPLFIFLLFGTLEFGGLFRDYLTINDASASGARGAAIAGNDANADYQILQGIKASTNALTKTGIKKIIVYKATDSSTPVPANCKSLTPDGHQRRRPARFVQRLRRCRT